ncbi:sulfate ABC transporter permease subunit CysT [Nocardioides baekrokdamisoli]|uniref:Sulfate transport system permease protein CysT n=1 Tax=Nocardioides baekrokdamisoli TaxID=1804624 RepID=A0A3G9IF74_9ACTN|nr:sulfate ABC transporter permease subunit CysT [Nocardioides baekrokdamisoli]BBH17670.1 sulfate ABC transporter permease subunit CysT [Nocardioides baekrokdamisoli]
MKVAYGPRPGLGRGPSLALGMVTLWVSLVVLIPLAAVVANAFGHGGSSFWHAVSNPEVVAALKLTVGLSVGAALVNAVAGVVIAWVLVRERFPGAKVLEFLVDLPFALPTIVTGVVMLGLYGVDSPLGVNLQGARAGLFVSLLFVTLPFTVRTVQPVLLNLDRDAELAANSLGASPATTFRRIVAPTLLPAVCTGLGLALARALGEYGSLVLISSNLPFKTEVASSLIYGKLQNADDPAATQQAAAIATVLLVAGVLLLIALAVIQRRAVRRGQAA